MARQSSYVYDNAVLLKDAGVIGASAAAQVGGADRILDLGGAVRTNGVVIVDTTAVEVGSTDEEFTIRVQVSDVDDFTTDVPATNHVYTVAELTIGAIAKTGSSHDNPAIGRYEIPFSTNYLGTNYRYLRLYTFVAGTIATGVNYKAFASLNAMP